METLSRSQSRALATQRRDLEHAMKDPQTRRFIRALLDACGLFAVNTHVGPEAMFAEGKRAVGLALVAEMNEIDVHLFPRLMQEGANEVVRLTNAARKQETDDV